MKITLKDLKAAFKNSKASHITFSHELWQSLLVEINKKAKDEREYMYLGDGWS
jgi:hypothetical protein